MEETTLRERFELYNDTINKCGTYLLTTDDETIEYIIYEEFDIGIHSFLHIDNLKILFENGLISKGKMNKSLELREKVIQLQSSGEWGIEYLRKSKKWMEVFLLCDELNIIE